MSDIMSDMKTTSVRDMQHRLSAILSEVESGEEIVITRRGKVVARLIPPEKPAAPTVRWPDSMSRMRRIFPEGPPAGTPASSLIEQQREERL